MTRGTFFLIRKNPSGPGPDIYGSDEFNGDMYLEGHGANAIELYRRMISNEDEFSTPWDDEQFRNYVLEFNKAAHKYNEDEVGVYYREDIITADWKAKEGDRPLLEIPSEEYFDRFFSDYIYIINQTETALRIKDRGGRLVVLEHTEMGVFCFGYRAYKVYRD